MTSEPSLWDDLVARADKLYKAETWSDFHEEFRKPVAGASLPSGPPPFLAAAGLQVVDQFGKVRPMSPDEQGGREPFCSMMIVRKEEGLTLKMSFKILPTPQQEEIEIVTSPDDELFMKIFFSEGGAGHQDHGILVESAHGFAVAYVDTGDLHSNGPGGAESVGIVRPSLSSGDPLPKPYCYAVREAGTGLVVVRHGKKDGPAMASVRIDASATRANLTDHRGGLLATMTGTWEGAYLRISQEMDAALAVCAFTAAFKLSDFSGTR